MASCITPHPANIASRPHEAEISKRFLRVSGLQKGSYGTGGQRKIIGTTSTPPRDNFKIFRVRKSEKAMLDSGSPHVVAPMLLAVHFIYRLVQHPPFMHDMFDMK